MAETYLTIGDFIRGRECDYLDRQAFGFSGKGIEPVPVSTRLQTDPRLRFIDRFNQKSDLARNPPPWKDVPTVTRQLAENFYKVVGTQTYSEFPGLRDSSYEWQFVDTDETVIVRRIRERRDGWLTRGVVYFDVLRADEGDIVYSQTPQLSLGLRYTKDGGKTVPQDFRINLGLGPEESIISAFYGPNEYLQSFGFYSGNLKNIFTFMQQVNQDVQSFKKDPRCSIDIPAYIAIAQTHRVGEGYTRGYITDSDLRRTEYVGKDMGFNVRPMVDMPDDLFFLGFTPLRMYDKRTKTPIVGYDQAKFLSGGPLNIGQYVFANYGSDRIENYRMDPEKLRIKSYPASARTAPDIIAELPWQFGAMTHLADKLTTTRNITGVSIEEILEPFDFKLPSLHGT